VAHVICTIGTFAETPERTSIWKGVPEPGSGAATAGRRVRPGWNGVAGSSATSWNLTGFGITSRLRVVRDELRKACGAPRSVNGSAFADERILPVAAVPYKVITKLQAPQAGTHARLAEIHRSTRGQPRPPQCQKTAAGRPYARGTTYGRKDEDRVFKLFQTMRYRALITAGHRLESR